MGRCPLLIARDPAALPFNLAALRCLAHETTTQGLYFLREELTRRIRVFLVSASKRVGE
jgi:hypothetical protein